MQAEKQFISLDGFQLAYQSFNEGQKNKIFLLHGNSGSSLMWRKQVADPLLSSFQLIAFDLPCHGDSEDFGFPDKVMDLAAVAAVLNQALEQLAPDGGYILAGLSLGTNVIAEMIRLGGKPSGVVLLGPCLWHDTETLGKMAKPGTGVEIVFQDGAEDRKVARYARNTSLSTDPEDLECFLADYVRVKPGWRTRLGASLPASMASSEWDTMKAFSLPALIVFGGDEKIIDNTYLDQAGLPLWREEIVLVPGASHLVNIDQPKAVNELIRAYAIFIFTEINQYAQAAR